MNDEYEIVTSKVIKAGAAEESKTSGRNSSAVGHVNTNLRHHFASPSPDIGPHANRNRNSSIN